MNIEKFEDMRIWQEARVQCKEIYAGFALVKDYGFKDQIQRAAVSVMNNIAEGFEKRTDSDFAKFLDIAKGSNGEIRSMLYLAEDLTYLAAPLTQQLRSSSEALSRSIETLAKYLRRKSS